MKFRQFPQLIVFLILPFLAFDAAATVLPGIETIYHELLSESYPTAFALMDVDVDDYGIEWVGQAIDGVKLSFAPKSLQWTRVNDLLVLPRARLVVEVAGGPVTATKSAGAVVGRVTYRGYTIPLNSEKNLNSKKAEIQFGLISGVQNFAEIALLRNGQEIHGKVFARFKPRNRSSVPRVFRDASCSRYHLSAESLAVDAKSAIGGALTKGPASIPASIPDDQWIYIGCRAVVAGNLGSRSTNLEVYVFWDQVGQEIEVEGIRTPASVPSVWAFKVNASPGVLRLRAGDHQLDLAYSLPKELHFANFSMGLGPYSYSFDALGKTAFNTRPILTLYGSYFFSDSIRFVGFNATAIGNSGFSDLGIYFNSENFRIIDRRLSINLLLGGHVIAVQVDGDYYLLPGIPQGVEMVFYDIFRKGSNLSLGGFVYPNINGTEYDNIWIRWGSRVFAEVNYILWQEKVREQRVYSRSLGVTFGFPLAQFF